MTFFLISGDQLEESQEIQEIKEGESEDLTSQSFASISQTENEVVGK